MLEVKDIHTYRGPAHVLNGVSLTVEAGEVVCLVGRNGAGKTTTMESIMGLLPVRQGVVEFRGKNITAIPAHLRAREGLGFAPEDSGIFPDLSVAENLEFCKLIAASTKGHGSAEMADERIRTLFPELPPLMGRRGLHLSGGQKKMVAIARAMALSPALLLLDEAFEGLAPVVVNRFREAVIKIKELGISLLIAESNLGDASRIADRLYAIDRGEIIFHGKPEEAAADPEVMRTLRG
jgi:ABC-type branched-subunit amino acid transport system ATPase component